MKRVLSGVLVVGLVALSSSGCATWGALDFNKRFPKVSIEDKQLQALAETQASLDQIKAASAYAHVRSADLQAALEYALRQPLEDEERGEYVVLLTEPSVQIATADIRIRSHFEARWLDPASKRTRVSVRGFVAIHGTPTVADSGNGGFSVGMRVSGEELRLYALAAEKELGWWWWFGERQAALKLATTLVNWAMERINGQIADAGAPLKLEPIALLAEHWKKPKNSIIDITDGKPVLMKLRLEPAAAAVDKSGIYAVGVLAPYDGEPVKPGPLPPVDVGDGSKEEKRRLIEEKNRTLLDGILVSARRLTEPLPAGSSVALAKKAVADLLNSSLAKVDRCATAAFTPEKQVAEFEIPMPKVDLHCADLDKIDCSTDERCFGYFRRIAEANQNMNCEKEEISWEGAACCMVAPSSLNPCCHKVVKKLLDAGCEALKAVAQGFVAAGTGIEDLADKLGQRPLLDNVCRAANFKDKLFCESVKGIAGGTCLLTQSALNEAWNAGEDIGQTGLIGWKVGDGDTDFDLHATGKACLSRVHVADDLASFRVNGSLDGRADVRDARLHFKPTAYGTAVVGCTEITIHAKDLSVTLAEAPGSYSGTVALDRCEDPEDHAIVPCLKVRPEEVEFRLKVDPEPVETIISQNWDDLALKCAWPTITGVPPIPFALSAAWVLNHYRDVEQLVGKDRQHFYIEQKFAPEVDPLLLRLKVERWDEEETYLNVDWRAGAIVGSVPEP